MTALFLPFSWPNLLLTSIITTAPAFDKDDSAPYSDLGDPAPDFDLAESFPNLDWLTLLLILT
jgi:hypothetical protein